MGWWDARGGVGGERLNKRIDKIAFFSQYSWFFTSVCGESESESRWIVDKLVEKGGGRGLARSAEEMDLDRVSVSSAQLAGGN